MEITNTGDLKLSAIPADIELEKDVLGVFLLESQSFGLFADHIHEGCFFDPRNATVFKAILALFRSGKDIDTISVTNELNKSGFNPDNAFFITSMTMRVASSAHMETWVTILQEKHIMRELLKVGQWLYYSALDPANDALDLYSTAEEKITRILATSFFVQDKSFGEILKETIAEIKEASENKGGIIGLQTGFSFIDHNMMGLVAPDLTIIAARPGMGKTTLAFHIALNLARRGDPVGVFSYEMKDRQLMWKTLSHFLPEVVNKIRGGSLSASQWTDIGDKYDTIGGLPIWINDRGFVNTDEMKAIVKNWIVKHGIKAIVIDYLQLVPATPEMKRMPREAIVSHNSRAIKGIAMECDIPVILLSQLSRNGAGREPELHDLRESGAIEQDADNVIFINMNDEETQKLYPGWVEGDPEWVVDWLLKKCRLGSMGRRKMILNAAHNTYKEIGYKDNLIPIEKTGYTDYSEPQDAPF